MIEENISQEFWLENINETENYFLEEIKRNELMNKKHKMVYTTLNYIEHFLILASKIIGCISVSAFDWYSYRNCEFCNRIKNCPVTAGIKDE